MGQAGSDGGGMITYSGVLVTPENQEAPSLLDIAVHLGRQPRFGGATVRPWTVLLHSLVCERLMSIGHPAPLPMLHALLHDAHEAITCDVPSTWKNPETRRQQWELDVRIFRSLRIPIPDWETEGWITEVDVKAVVAEGMMYGPPGIARWFGIEPDEAALDIASDVGTRYLTAQDTDGPNAPAVLEFLSVADNLLNSWRESLHGGSEWVRKPKG